jgi:hypothetical protein
LDLTRELTNKIKIELLEKGKNFNESEMNSFLEWMKIEYKNYMLLTRDETIKTLDRLKVIYGSYSELIDVLKTNIHEYGSLQSFYRVSLELTK